MLTVAVIAVESGPVVVAVAAVAVGVVVLHGIPDALFVPKEIKVNK